MYTAGELLAVETCGSGGQRVIVVHYGKGAPGNRLEEGEGNQKHPQSFSLFQLLEAKLVNVKGLEKRFWTWSLRYVYMVTGGTILRYATLAPHVQAPELEIM